MVDEEDWVDCGHCAGEGRVVLTSVYALTLAALRKVNGETTATKLASKFKVEQTAMLNRLAWLESNGFAVKRRYGRQLFWRAVI